MTLTVPMLLTWLTKSAHAVLTESYQEVSSGGPGQLSSLDGRSRPAKWLLKHLEHSE